MDSTRSQPPAKIRKLSKSLGVGEITLKNYDENLICWSKTTNISTQQNQIAKQETQKKSEPNKPYSACSDAAISGRFYSIPHMGSLPAETLSYIFQHLEWRYRLRLERACKLWQQLVRRYGWRDVRSFDGDKWIDAYGGKLSQAYRVKAMGRLLLCIGPSLTSLALSDISEEFLRMALKLSPNIKHLCLQYIHLDASILDYIQNSYAKQLKSLITHCCRSLPNGSDCEAPGMPAKKKNCKLLFNELLSHCTILEYLEVYEDSRCWVTSYGSELDFVPTMANLRTLVIRPRDRYRSKWLNSDAAEKLAELTTLRSLTLWRSFESDTSFAFLRKFTRLEHLHINVIIQDGHSLHILVEAVSHMKTLKALELRWVSSFDEHSLTSIVDNLPQLEHLSLHAINRSTAKDSWLNTIPNKLGHLLSMELIFDFANGPPTNWRWLELMPQLEHLCLKRCPKLADRCYIIKTCQNLRCLALFEHIIPNIDDWNAIIEAAKCVRAEKNNQQPRALMVSLSVSPPYNVQQYNQALVDINSRLRYIEKWRNLSHVMRRHKYGCLREGVLHFADGIKRIHQLT